MSEETPEGLEHKEAQQKQAQQEQTQRALHDLKCRTETTKALLTKGGADIKVKAALQSVLQNCFGYFSDAKSYPSYLTKGSSTM